MKSVSLKECHVFQSLSKQHQKFVLAYIKSNFNGAEAAKEAGYAVKSANVQGSRLLTDDSIKKAVEEVKSILVDQPNIASVTEVLEFLTLVMRGNIRKVASWNEQGLSFVVDQSEEMNEANARLIKKVKVTEKTSQKGDWTECKTEVELHDPVRAAELLGKYHGAFTDKVEHSGSLSIDYTNRLESARGKAADAIMRAKRKN